MVALLGSRQVGKTTLARDLELRKPVHYLDLERLSDLAKLADPELYLGRFVDHLVVLDEIQRLLMFFLSSEASWTSDAASGKSLLSFSCLALPRPSFSAKVRRLSPDAWLIEQVLGHPVCVHSWEGYCIAQAWRRNSPATFGGGALNQG